MHCPMCGLTMDDSLNFCTNCGANLRQGGMAPQPDSRVPMNYGQGQYDQNGYGQNQYDQNQYDQGNYNQDYNQLPKFTGDTSDLASLIMYKKSEVGAFLMSLVLPGTGLMYLGLKKGMIILLLYAACILGTAMLFLFCPLDFYYAGTALAAFGLWVYGLIDSYSRAKEYNYLLMQNNGQPPW